MHVKVFAVDFKNFRFQQPSCAEAFTTGAFWTPYARSMRVGPLILGRGSEDVSSAAAPSTRLVSVIISPLFSHVAINISGTKPRGPLSRNMQSSHRSATSTSSTQKGASLHPESMIHGLTISVHLSTRHCGLAGPCPQARIWPSRLEHTPH